MPGLRKFKAWLPQTSGLAGVVYAATGPQHAALERGFGTELPLVKVNPLPARRFAQSKGSRVKTDAMDAKMLAQMGAALELVPQVPVSQNMRDLKEMQIARLALIKDRIRLLNVAPTPPASTASTDCAKRGTRRVFFKRYQRIPMAISR